MYIYYFNILLYICLHRAFFLRTTVTHAQNSMSCSGLYIGKMEFAGCSKVHGTFFVKQYSSLGHGSRGEHFISSGNSVQCNVLISWN